MKKKDWLFIIRDNVIALIIATGLIAVACLWRSMLARIFLLVTAGLLISFAKHYIMYSVMHNHTPYLSLCFGGFNRRFFVSFLFNFVEYLMGQAAYFWFDKLRDLAFLALVGGLSVGVYHVETLTFHLLLGIAAILTLLVWILFSWRSEKPLPDMGLLEYYPGKEGAEWVE